MVEEWEREEGENEPLNRSPENLLENNKNCLSSQPIVLLLELKEGDKEIADGGCKISQPLLDSRGGWGGRFGRSQNEVVLLNESAVVDLLRKALDDRVHHRRRRRSAEEVVDSRCNGAIERAHYSLAEKG